MNDILTINNQSEERFLHQKTKPFDWRRFSKKEIRDLVSRMRRLMREAHGIGLAANQIGLDFSFFVASVENKFYAVANPAIEKRSGGLVDLEEGCLSVPGKYGVVPRHERVTLSGYDLNGKKIKIKAWGLLAHVFQHETDHLNGILFVDKAKALHDTPATGRLAGREERFRRQTGKPHE